MQFRTKWKVLTDVITDHFVGSVLWCGEVNRGRASEL